MLGWEVYCLPLITALVGWGTNYLAVKMLFHPRRRIFGLQGVVPKRHHDLAEKLALMFEKELLSGDDLLALFEKVDFEKELEGLIDDKIGVFMTRLKQEIPMAQMFLQGSLEESLKKKGKKALLEMAPEVKRHLGERLGDLYDVRFLVEEKLKAFSVERMEKIVLQVASKELRTIEYLGGVLGFAIGILQILWLQI
jgi:uncharacterized membrane protein YheB (UPF0754 family)